MLKDEKELKDLLEELYRYYFGRVRQLSNEVDEESVFYEAKAQGGLEAVETIYLQLYGGKETYRLWEGELKRYDKTAGG